MTALEGHRNTVDHLLDRCRAAQYKVSEPSAARTLESALKRLSRLHEDLRDWEPLLGSPLEAVEEQLRKITRVIEPILAASESVEHLRIALAPPRVAARVMCTAKTQGSGWLVTVDKAPEVLVLDRAELDRSITSPGALLTDDLELWRETVAGTPGSPPVVLALHVDRSAIGASG